MRHALGLAQQAAAVGEVPVGAVIVRDGIVVGQGHNTPVAGHDPTAHAEVQALRDAAHRLGNWRLDGCTLYVTLEPCAMCAGAVLNARLDRVVYGAAEPRTGAAGSVLNLFALPQINHHTTVTAGVLAADCGAVMTNFFRQRRTRQHQQAQAAHPLPDTALRLPPTSLQALAQLPDWPWPPRWRNDLPSAHRLRLAAVDESGPVPAQHAAHPGPCHTGKRSDTGQPDECDILPCAPASPAVPATLPADPPTPLPLTWLCIHGHAEWGYAFRHLLPPWLEAGHRVVVPDLPGFGRSDRPKKTASHTADWHIRILGEWVQALNLQRIILVARGDGARLGLAVAQTMPHRFIGAWLHDAWPGNATPPTWQDWHARAAHKPTWPVGVSLLALYGLRPPPRPIQPHNPDHLLFPATATSSAKAPPSAPDLAGPWDIPFPDRGHRAALAAWPAVQAGLPPPPLPLLHHWQAQGRLWVTLNAGHPLLPEAAWRTAWQHALHTPCHPLPAAEAAPCNSIVLHTLPCQMWHSAHKAATQARQAVQHFTHPFPSPYT